MEKILKDSYIYRFLVVFKNWLEKLCANSFFVQTFLENHYCPQKYENAWIVKIARWFLKTWRKIAQKLKLNRIFENSIFAKPILWVTLTIALIPVVPTMVDVGLVIVSMASLLLKLAIDDDFAWKHDAIHAWILAFCLVIVVASFISISTAESLKIALVMITFVMFYFVVVNTITTREQGYRILYLLLIVATLTAIYGLYQYVFGDVYSQAWLDSEMFEEIKMRVYATLENPNVYGEYLLLMIPLNIALLWTQKGWKKKLFLCITLGITSLAMVLTFSRGCWLGLVIAIALLAFVIDKRFLILGMILLLLSPTFLPDTIMNRFLSIGNIQDSSTSYRVNIWLGTIAMLKDYWISGVGMGMTSFNTIYPLYAYNNVPAPHSHNLFLQVIVEYGICGFIILMGIFYYYFKHLIISLKTKKNIVLAGFMTGMIGFLIQSLTDNTWYNYRVVLLFWVMIAMGTVFSKINLEEKENDKSCECN